LQGLPGRKDVVRQSLVTTLPECHMVDVESRRGVVEQARWLRIAMHIKMLQTELHASCSRLVFVLLMGWPA
jgi:hypothetical protein